MTRFADRRELLEPPQQAAWDAIAQRRGKVPAPYLPLLASPSTALAFEAFSSSLWDSALHADEQELVYLVVAKAWQCEHQWQTHEPKARLAGVPEALIDWAATQERPLAEPLGRLEVVAALSQRLQRAGPVEEALMRQAADVLGPQRLSDLLAFITLATSIALLLNAM